MRRRWRLALVALLSIFAVAEVALRLFGWGNPPIAVRDAALEYRLVPDNEYRRWGNRIYINSYGFRAPDHTGTASSAEVRLLLIGDSVVYGNHFLDQEETIAQRLSAILSSSSCTVRVIPMAVSSWGPVNQMAALSRYGTFQAAEVAIILSSHDLIDTPVGHDASVIPYRLSPPMGAIGDFIEALFERLFPSTPEPAPMSFEDRAQTSLSALNRIKDQVEAQGAELLFVYNATVSERTSGTSDNGLRLFHWAEQNGVDVFDLGVIPDIGYRDSIHPNANGTASIAQALAERYSDQLVCGSRS